MVALAENKSNSATIKLGLALSLARGRKNFPGWVGVGMVGLAENKANSAWAELGVSPFIMHFFLYCGPTERSGTGGVS